LGILPTINWLCREFQKMFQCGNMVTSVWVIMLVTHERSVAIFAQDSKGVVMEEKKGNFDERYHASYACKLKTIPLEKIESAIAKAVGELTHDRVECTIINFNAESQLAQLVISLDIGRDKRYSK
jgi:hypothetical protein